VPVTAEEYRKSRTKTVKLSSGFSWVIQKIPVDVMSEFLEVIGIKMKPGMSMKAIEKHLDELAESPEFKKRLFESMQIVIPGGAVNPKIVRSGKAPDGALTIDEIAAVDQFELFMEIVRFQSLPEKAKKFPE